MRSVEASVDLQIPPQDILDAFIEPQHLKAWWGVDRSLIDPQKGGLYTLVWSNGSGAIQYVTTGVITEYLPACQLMIGNLVYISPGKAALGPMQLGIFTTPQEDLATRLTVVQSGYQSGPEWDRYYNAVREKWPEVLNAFSAYMLLDSHK